MKALHINDECNVSFNFAAGLESLGHHAEVWCEQRPDARLPLAAKLAYLPVRLATFRRLNARIKREHFDIVHIHNADRGWIGILGGYPYFLHCHGSDIRIGLLDPVRKVWTVPALKRARRVIFTTPDLAECLRDIRPDAIFLPNPIRTDLFVPPADHQPGRPRILLFSAFDIRLKGTAVAVEALARIHAVHPEVTISALGLGVDLERFKTFPWLDLMPPVDPSAVPSVLARFDIIVGQFSLGQLGVSELEAMACERPVVCYVNDLFSAAYEEPPPVLSANEPEGIAQHISELIADENARRELGRRGRKWVVDNHDYIGAAKTLIDVYAAATPDLVPPRFLPAIP